MCVSPLRLKEAKYIEPFVAQLHANKGTMTFSRPDTPYHRLEPRSMLIHTPQFDLILG